MISDKAIAVNILIAVTYFGFAVVTNSFILKRDQMLRKRQFHLMQRHSGQRTKVFRSGASSRQAKSSKPSSAGEVQSLLTGDYRSGPSTPTSKLSKQSTGLPSDGTTQATEVLLNSATPVREGPPSFYQEIPKMTTQDKKPQSAEVDFDNRSHESSTSHLTGTERLATSSESSLDFLPSPLRNDFVSWFFVGVIFFCVGRVTTILVSVMLNDSESFLGFSGNRLYVDSLQFPVSMMYYMISQMLIFFFITTANDPRGTWTLHRVIPLIVVLSAMFLVMIIVEVVSVTSTKTGTLIETVTVTVTMMVAIAYVVTGIVVPSKMGLLLGAEDPESGSLEEKRTRIRRACFFMGASFAARFVLLFPLMQDKMDALDFGANLMQWFVDCLPLGVMLWLLKT